MRATNLYLFLLTNCGSYAICNSSGRTAVHMTPGPLQPTASQHRLRIVVLGTYHSTTQLC